MTMRHFSIILFLSQISSTFCQLSSPEYTLEQPLLLDIPTSLFQCCDLISNNDPKSLISCVNASVTENFENILNLVPYLKKKHGPKLMVALITRATQEIYHYAAYSYFLQAVYSSHNFYGLLPLFQDSLAPDYQLYRKIVPILEALQGVALHSDYIVWLDADIVYLDIGMRVEKVNESLNI